MLNYDPLYKNKGKYNNISQTTINYEKLTPNFYIKISQTMIEYKRITQTILIY